ncbi:Hypothetical predicted protein, partial [Mytilus galloprovincialis]
MHLETLVAFIILSLYSINSYCHGSKVKLATTPNIDVLEYGDAVFMEVVEPEAISYLFKLRRAKNFGADF